MRPLVGPQTAILPLQNGVESADRLSGYFGKDAVLAGAVWVVAAVTEPGVIRQESQFRRIVFGELAGRVPDRVRAIHAALASSGATVETTDQIEKVLWTKLLFIASFSGITSVTRAPAGAVWASAESRLLLSRAMREVEAVAQAKHIVLEEDVVEKTMAFVGNLEPSATSSMQRDVVAGRRLEHEAINGVVVRFGRQTGVPTPVHEFFWTCLQVVDAVARGGPA
jgi:2-dehydropantoate 2-reductase